MHSPSPLSPTFQEHIASTHDALLLFEACLTGHLNHVARRPHDRERSSLIKSGNVFIYEERSSGIKGWTDRVPWSPSSVLESGYGFSLNNRSFDQSNLGNLNKETEHSLIGSLVDSYGFKEDGLVKKTVSVTVGGVSHHLVSYYTVADVISNKLGMKWYWYTT
ncbi:Global transcription regulator sge1 [Clarireedia jacksonii]